MPVIPLECPSCGTGLIIDSDESAAICTSCGRPFVVKDAIVLNYIKIVTDTNETALTCDEFETEGDTLKKYNGSSPCVDIPDNIRVIGSRAFEDCKDIVEVNLTGSVEIIEDNAFTGCGNLQTVHFTDKVKRIGSYAFSECACLKEVILPEAVEKIGPYAFSSCYMLSFVKMPSAQSDVHETAFAGDSDARFEWSDDWKSRQLKKVKIVAPALGGMVKLFDSRGACDTVSETLLYFGTSDLGLSDGYNFYTYKGFMNLFSIDKNNNDPYLLRTSVENARMRYEAVEDIQKSYSELISLLDRAKISRSKIEMINIPRFIWKQGKSLNDYKIKDIGVVPVLQIKLSV